MSGLVIRRPWRQWIPPRSVSTCSPVDQHLRAKARSRPETPADDTATVWWPAPTRCMGDQNTTPPSRGSRILHKALAALTFRSSAVSMMATRYLACDVFGEEFRQVARLDRRRDGLLSSAVPTSRPPAGPMPAWAETRLTDCPPRAQSTPRRIGSTAAALRAIKKGRLVPTPRVRTATRDAAVPAPAHSRRPPRLRRGARRRSNRSLFAHSTGLPVVCDAGEATAPASRSRRLPAPLRIPPQFTELSSRSSCERPTLIQTCRFDHGPTPAPAQLDR
jgi:hypothetical protein